MTHTHTSLATQRRRQGSSLAELAPVLFVFLFMVLFPMINLMGYVTGLATVALITTNCAVVAQNSNSFADALLQAKLTATLLANSPFGKFAHLHPIGGFGATGIDLYIDQTDPNDSQNNLSYGPNIGMPASASPNLALPPGPSNQPPSNYVYQYRVQAHYVAKPFLNLAGVPFIGSIPMLGKAAPISYTACRLIEHTESLGDSDNGGDIGTGGGNND